MRTSRSAGFSRWRVTALMAVLILNQLGVASTAQEPAKSNPAGSPPAPVRLKHEYKVDWVGFSPDGKPMAAGGKWIYVWETATGKELRRQKMPSNSPSGIVAFAFSPDGKTAVSGNNDGEICIGQPATGKEGKPLGAAEDHGYYVRALAFSPDGKTVASAGGNSIYFWEAATGKELLSLHSTEKSSCIVFSPDGKTLAAGGTTGTLQLWQVATGRQLFRLSAHQSKVLSIAFSPDGRMLASAGSDKTLRVWEVVTGKEIFLLRGHEGIATAVAFAPGGPALASAGADRTVRLWHQLTGKELLCLGGYPNLEEKRGRFPAIAFSPDGNTLAAGSLDEHVYLWDLSGLRLEQARQGKNLGAAELDKLWADLAGDDAATAYRRIEALAATPRQAVPYLKERLRPAVPAELEPARRLIADLDSNSFEAREQATRKLESLGESAELALQQALDGKPPLEVLRRIERLLAKIAQRVATPEQLRVLRAIAVLEWQGTAEARQVLANLAEGVSGAWTAQEAKAALERLGKRSAATR